jgi:hypothetical protein
MSKIAVYVPTRGDVWHETAAALGAALPTYVRCTTGVQDARHMIVAEFLKSDADVCVMCDDDVIPPVGLWQQVVNHVTLGRADVCAAICPVILEGTVFLPNVFVRDDSLEKGYKLSLQFIMNKGLHEVDAVGTGFIAIHRRVFEDKRMKDPFKADFIHGRGEDVQFCRRAKQARYKVFADFDVWCDHMVTVHANAIANSYMDVLNKGMGYGSE